MASRKSSYALLSLVLMAATSAVTTLTGLVLNAATDVKHWPWPFRMMQDHPWRWLVALMLVTIVLGALAWWVAIKIARAEEGGGADSIQPSTVTGNVVQISEGGHGLVQIFTGRSGPTKHPPAYPSPFLLVGHPAGEALQHVART